MARLMDMAFVPDPKAKVNTPDLGTTGLRCRDHIPGQGELVYIFLKVHIDFIITNNLVAVCIEFVIVTLNAINLLRE